MAGARLGYHALRAGERHVGIDAPLCICVSGNRTSGFYCCNSAAAALSAIITSEGCNLSTEAGTCTLTGPSTTCFNACAFAAPLTISNKFFAAITLRPHGDIAVWYCRDIPAHLAVSDKSNHFPMNRHFDRLIMKAGGIRQVAAKWPSAPAPAPSDPDRQPLPAGDRAERRCPASACECSLL